MILDHVYIQYAMTIMINIYFQSEKISNCDKDNQMLNILSKIAEFKIQ